MGDIKAAAEIAATRSLGKGTVRDILVEPAVGSEGQDILWITIVIDDDGFDAIKDDDFLTILLSVKKSVQETGEERQAIVGYATQAELDDNGDPES